MRDPHDMADYLIKTGLYQNKDREQLAQEIIKKRKAFEEKQRAGKQEVEYMSNKASNAGGK